MADASAAGAANDATVTAQDGLVDVDAIVTSMAEIDRQVAREALQHKVEKLRRHLADAEAALAELED